ncbi:MAG TPA: amino acid permease [Thermoplasmatales archaeon]|nr:amino acid permease [Thermoplasmatales archaeon]
MSDKKAKIKEASLKKELGLFDLFCIASGAMISSGLFILPGLAYAKTGPAVIVAYFIASILVIPAMLSKAELATAMPKAGGTYFYIDRSMGPALGTVGGFAAWFSLAFKSAFALLGIGAFTLLLNPGFTEIQIKLIAVVFCIIFTIINLVGVKHTGKTQIILVVGLLSLLAFYIVAGVFHVQLTNFTPFAPASIGSIFATAGFVFISYGGLTKVCSVAEECKNPGRILPLGMFLSWAVVSLLYTMVIFVTIGLVEPNQLQNSLTPISLGAGVFMGEIGVVIMAIAAILAFVSTANAGLLAASRNPMAMGKDDLLPRFFAKVSKYKTPSFSIIFTSVFMIFVILFLDIEGLVKTASTMKLLLFMFVTISVIIMRESKIRHYQPKFRSPLYPWVHIAGIIGYGFILFEMGITPLLAIGIFIVFGLSWYLAYARPKIKREYALLHVIERITGIESTGYLMDEELREILIERDDVTEKRFEEMIKKCLILDLEKMLSPDEFTKLLAHKLAEEIDVDEEELYKSFMKREKDSNIVVYPGIAILSLIIKGRNKFDVILVRSKKGIIFSDNIPPVHAFFVIVSSSDEQSFYFHSLMWIVQISEDIDFEERWLNAKNRKELRNIILSSWEKLKITQNFL